MNYVSKTFELTVGQKVNWPINHPTDNIRVLLEGSGAFDGKELINGKPINGTAAVGLATGPVGPADTVWGDTLEITCTVAGTITVLGWR